MLLDTAICRKLDEKNAILPTRMPNVLLVNRKYYFFCKSVWFEFLSNGKIYSALVNIFIETDASDVLSDCKI